MNSENKTMTGQNFYEKQDYDLNENTSLDTMEDVYISDNENGKTISRKTALLSAGGALLSGAALGKLFSGSDEISEVKFDSNNDNIVDSILTDSNNDGIFETQQFVENSSEEPQIDDLVEEETIESSAFSPNTAPLLNSEKINDQMSFAEAFSTARKELGPGGVFAWKGEYYNTFYAEEINESYEPNIEYATVDHHALPKIETTQETEFANKSENEVINNDVDVKIIENEADIPEGTIEVQPEPEINLSANNNTQQNIHTEDIDDSGMINELPEEDLLIEMQETEFDDFEDSNQLL